MVAGQADGVPAACIRMTSRRTFGVSGPRSHVVADEDRAPPVRVTVLGVAELREQRDELVVAAVDVADDVERARSARRSAHSGARTISTSSSGLTTCVKRKPSFCRWRSERRRSRVWRRMTCGPKARSGRVALRAWHVASGVSRTIAAANRSCSRAIRTSAARDSCWTLVASMTVSRPRASRRDVISCSTANASLVASWSLGSSATSARQKSELTLRRQEMAGRERALAGAGGADQHDEAGIAQLDLHRSNTAICVGGPASGSSGPTGTKRAA